MLDVTVKSKVRTSKTRTSEVIYRLTFQNALYSFECYKQGWEDPYDYCFIEDFIDDEGEAELFLQKMVKGKVLPVHIMDLVNDCFGVC
ncbi:MAG: hypothetical protein K0S47_911 [Herbinix sp.]|nr:hypothetical protein [Herbinix sp.]